MTRIIALLLLALVLVLPLYIMLSRWRRAARSEVSGDDLVARIDALLPQTQCGQCSHPGCRPYAEAIAAGEAINHCVPGGQSTINALAELMSVPTLPLDPEYGQTPALRLVAFIREDECIGCTKCIQACPVDAIVGAAKLMHTVIADECTGCDLCVDPCPVDCIDMIPRALQLPLEAGFWPRPSLVMSTLLINSGAVNSQAKAARIAVVQVQH